MVFIIENLKYDTDKMELVGKVKKWYPTSYTFLKALMGDNYGKNYDCDLYRSRKGNWLLVWEDDYASHAEAVYEEDAKELLKHCNYTAYVKIFGELEEA